MDFSDMIKAHAKRVEELRGHEAVVGNEEATKTALIMPFLRMLGYDPYDPRVVIPEYTADFGEKKGCKVDFAIRRGDDIVIIVEAKKVGESLDGSRESQLQQYFQSLLAVKIGILTDGVVYKFYTDLDHPNVMDKKSFMTFDFSTVDEALIPELKKLCNDCFDLSIALDAALELKYLGQIKKLVAKELEKPSDEFTRLFAKQVYDGHLIAKIMEEFRPRVRAAFETYINEEINARLQSAIQPSSYISKADAEEEQAGAEPVIVYGNVQGGGIETTPEEIEGYHIVKAIMSKVVDPARVFMRDAASYCAILLDNKNTKPICRMHFNAASVKYLETFDAEKKGTKHKLENINDIYQHTDAVRATVGFYENSAAGKTILNS